MPECQEYQESAFGTDKWVPCTCLENFWNKWPTQLCNTSLSQIEGITRIWGNQFLRFPDDTNWRFGHKRQETPLPAAVVHREGGATSQGEGNICVCGGVSSQRQGGICSVMRGGGNIHGGSGKKPKVSSLLKHRLLEYYFAPFQRHRSKK